MLGVLMLSVNLIEHRPDASRKATPSNRPAVEHAAEHRADPARTAPIAQAAPTAAVEPGAGGADVDGHALSPDAVIANAVGADMPLAPGMNGAGTQAALFDAAAPTMDGAVAR
jgi:hypothetical protein